MNFLQDFHFIRPFWLIAIVFVIFIYIKYFKGLKNKSSWEKVCDKHLLSFLIKKGSANSRKNLGYISMTAILSSILIIASPVWNKKDIQTLAPENPSIILLSLSTDMTSQMSSVRYMMTDFLDENMASQIGLIAYSDEPFLITPITDDKNIIKNILPDIDPSIMPNNGDNLYRGIDLAVQSFENAKYKSGNIIIFASNIGENFEKAIYSAKQAENKNYLIYIVNIEKNEKLDYIAKGSDVKKISNEIAQNFDIQMKENDNKSNIWIEYGYYFLFIPFICCLLFFRKGILIILFVFSFSNNVFAGFFQNQNQEAFELYQAEKYDQALKKFDDPKWIGASLYKSGDYENALKYFSGDDETSLYNQGNALAKSGKIEEAIKKYEEVLLKNENNSDAKFNLEYLRQKQNQQNNNENDSQDKDKKDEDKKQDSQSKEANQEENKNKEDKEQKEKNEQNHNLKESDDKKKQNQKETKVQKNKKEQGQEVEGLSEEIQKREQTYRKIPENPSGLIKAFLYKEYLKNRYSDFY